MKRYIMVLILLVLCTTIITTTAGARTSGKSSCGGCSGNKQHQQYGYYQNENYDTTSEEEEEEEEEEEVEVHLPDDDDNDNGIGDEDEDEDEDEESSCSAQKTCPRKSCQSKPKPCQSKPKPCQSKPQPQPQPQSCKSKQFCSPWKVLNTDLPPQTDFAAHKSCLFNDRIIIFGGLKENRSLAINFDGSTFDAYYGTTFAFDLKTKTWIDLIPETSNKAKPSPRGFFGMACVESSSKSSSPTMYLFGGLAEDTFPLPADDLWRYDVKKNTWTQIVRAPGAAWPSPRSATILKSMTARGRDVLVLYGGASPSFSDVNQTWIYDLGRGVWSQGQSLPRGNINPMSTVHNNRLFIYGGERNPYPGSQADGLWRWAPEVYSYNPNKGAWTLVVNNTNEHIITDRSYAAASSLQSRGGGGCGCKGSHNNNNNDNSVSRQWFIVGGDYGIWRNGAPVYDADDCNVLNSIGVDYLVGEALNFDLAKGRWGTSFLPESFSPVSPYKISVPDELGMMPPDDRDTVQDPRFAVIPALKRADMVCDYQYCYITGGWGGIGTRAGTINGLNDQFYNNDVWRFSPSGYF